MASSPWLWFGSRATATLQRVSSASAAGPRGPPVRRRPPAPEDDGTTTDSEAVPGLITGEAARKVRRVESGGAGRADDIVNDREYGIAPGRPRGDRVEPESGTLPRPRPKDLESGVGRTPGGKPSGVRQMDQVHAAPPYTARALPAAHSNQLSAVSLRCVAAGTTGDRGHAWPHVFRNPCRTPGGVAARRATGARQSTCRLFSPCAEARAS